MKFEDEITDKHPSFGTVTVSRVSCTPTSMFDSGKLKPSKLFFSSITWPFYFTWQFLGMIYSQYEPWNKGW